jgi:hypothetical protein
LETAPLSVGGGEVSVFEAVPGTSVDDGGVSGVVSGSDVEVVEAATVETDVGVFSDGAVSRF